MDLRTLLVIAIVVVVLAGGFGWRRYNWGAGPLGGVGLLVLILVLVLLFGGGRL